MKKFLCANCGGRVFYENSRCLGCQAELGFVAADLTISTFASAAPDMSYQRLGDGGLFKRCGNSKTSGACNWMIPSTQAAPFCNSCGLNRTIPDLSKSQNQQAWLKLETAKRRLLFSLLSLGLPVPSKEENPVNGLAFDFLEDAPTGTSSDERVFTGHVGGLITINLDETDDPKRERARQRMGEMYRTVLGHFRHEIGHYYWDVMVRDNPRLETFRKIFGDERSDYTLALGNHYSQGPPANWQQSHVSAYAAAHPWEDWAETWAHYLHILDTLETAAAEGLIIQDGGNQMVLQPPIGLPFADVAAQWRDVRLLLNGLNRSMGLPDPYPFVLAETVIGKLTLIHNWIAGRAE
jgi:hypothetical protein